MGRRGQQEGAEWGQVEEQEGNQEQNGEKRAREQIQPSFDLNPGERSAGPEGKREGGLIHTFLSVY